VRPSTTGIRNFPEGGWEKRLRPELIHFFPESKAMFDSAPPHALSRYVAPNHSSISQYECLARNSRVTLMLLMLLFAQEITIEFFSFAITLP